MNRRKFLTIGKTGFAATLSAVSINGCSRIERVKIINRFGISIRVRLKGQDTKQVISAHSERILDERFYIGGGSVQVTVFDTAGRPLVEKTVSVPGDSFSRPIAVVEITP